MNSTLQQNMASPSTFPTSPIRTLGELIADEKFDGQEMNFDITISTSQEISMVRQSNRRQSSNSNDKEVRVGGVFLTWQDLWVTVSTGKKGSHPILQGLTGYAQPGEVLAIMGPSGCGKSTLLDTLAGRLNTSTRQSGEIQVNGRKQRLSYGTSAYVTQDDTLLTTLMLGPSA